jgi:hypothetical protein
MAADAKASRDRGQAVRLSKSLKIGSEGYKAEVAKIPVGGYYYDPQNNLRKKVNGQGGNPIIRKAGSTKGALGEIGGFAANINRGLLIGDELSAGLGTVGNVLTGNIRPDAGSANPLSLARGVANDFGNQLAIQRGIEDNFDSRRPWAGAVGQTTGMVPTLFVPGGAPAQATTRTGAIVNASGNAALYAGVAGLADRGTWEERNKQGAINAAVTAPLAGGLTAALTRSGAPKLPRSPGVDELAARKGRAYEAADQAGVRYSPQGYDDMVTGMERDLTSVRLNPLRHPKAASMLDELRDLRGSSPTLTEVDQLRQVIRRDVANSTDDAEAFMGKRMIRELDGFISNAGGAQVAQGSGANGAALIGAARDANTRYVKTRDITDAMEAARLRAGSTGSGGNIDNAIRQNMKRELEGGANWTPAEKNALESIVLGTPGQNALRQVGKLSPQGNGLMAAGNLASAASFGPLGALPGGAGLVSKYFADRATQQNVTKLLDLIAAGGAGAQQARQAIIQLPNGAQFLDDLSRITGLSEAAANQNQPANAATAIR